MTRTVRERDFARRDLEEGDMTHDMAAAPETPEASQDPPEAIIRMLAETPEAAQDLPEAVIRMLSHIASSGAIIKSQQRDEQDVGDQEKFKLLLDMWHHNHVVFLGRFHTYLQEDDLDCFDDLSHEYEVNFYLREVRKRLDKSKSAVSVRNRRYEALKKLQEEGTFFSDEEMKSRDPLMFEQLIGQYQTDDERKKAVDPADLRFSNILTTFIEEQEIKERYGREKEMEDDMLEEGDSDEESDDDDEEEDEEEEDEDEPGSSETTTTKKKANKVKYDQHGYPIYKDWEPTPATDAEKAIMRQEFLTHMHQRFLSGKEKDNFDYSKVDYNAEYDSVDIRTQDEEERYFDDEDPEDVGSDAGDGGGGGGQDEGGEGELEEWETFGDEQMDEGKTAEAQSETPMDR